MTQTITVDTEVVGNIVSWLLDGKRAIGYWVDRSHWGKGIATEAFTQLGKSEISPADGVEEIVLELL